MASYKVKILDTEELDGWDEFVAKSDHGTLFHEKTWLQTVSEEFLVYGLFKGQELFAGFPVAVQNILGIKRAKTPTLTPWLGPVFQSTQAKYVTKVSNRKRMGKVIARKIKKDFDYVSINLSPLIHDLQPYIWENISSSVRYTYRLDLTDLSEIWDSMDASRRRNIRKAEKDGVVTEKSSDFDLIFDLVEKTFSRQDKAPHFKETAYGINEALNSKNRCQSFISRNLDGRPIATVYIIWDKNTAYYLLGGYDPEHSHHGASALAMWEAVQYSKEELELETFDFEGSMIQDIEKFFRKFGGQLTPYYSLTWGNLVGRGLYGGRQYVGRALQKYNLR